MEDHNSLSQAIPFYHLVVMITVVLNAMMIKE